MQAACHLLQLIANCNPVPVPPHSNSCAALGEPFDLLRWNRNIHSAEGLGLETMLNSTWLQDSPETWVPGYILLCVTVDNSFGLTERQLPPLENGMS